MSSDVTESKVRSADGTSIAYDRRGSGPPLVLVGGAFQYRAFDPRTAELADRLASSFTVFHYDRRGRGDSGEQLPYAREREVEDLAAVIAEAGGTAAVFAMSSGGALALEAALAGVDIERLALYEPPFIVDDSRPPLPDDYVEHLTELCEQGRPGDAVEYFLTTAAMVPAEIVAGMRQAPMWPGLEAVAHTLAYDGAFMHEAGRGDPEALRRWAPVTVPTLVAVGGDSPPYVPSAVEALAAVLPHGQTRTLPGQTHDVAPEVLAPVLEEFLGAEGSEAMTVGGRGFEAIGAEIGARVSVIAVDAAPGGGPRLHRHPYEEVFVMLEGEATFTLGDAQHVVHAGEVVVAPAGVPHAFTNTGSTRLRQVNVHVSARFDTEWLA